MKISLVIPSLNSVTLSETLTAVSTQARYPDEIIVVGRDEPGIISAFANVKFIDTEVPVCAAAARNRGIQKATGDIIAFLDSDCIPESDWLRRHEQRQQKGELIVGGSVSLKGSNYWAQSDNVSMFHEFVPQLPSGYRKLLPTLNLSVHRNVVKRVGLLDESFPGAAAEDADWTIRMRRAGFQLYFEPRALIHHSPARVNWPDIERHWRNLGYNAVRVRLRYPDDLGTPRLAEKAAWWRWLAPVIAARITAGVYAKPGFVRYWTSLP
ncbi:MAG: glycosyltransferase, partial [Anaerolineales bacterium]|nr:glycosyltransferase [Anaerolineales bacterium]